MFGGGFLEKKSNLANHKRGEKVRRVDKGREDEGLVLSYIFKD